jgi:hypothetical protein
MPRTGSTMAKRALQTVARFPLGECSHDAFRPSAPLVVTIRDWRDVLYSQWRIQFDYRETQPTINELRSAMIRLDSRLAQLRHMLQADKESHTVIRWHGECCHYPCITPNQLGATPTAWRYEEVYNDPTAAMWRVWAITGVKPDRDAIAAIVSVDAAKAIQDAVPTPETGRVFDSYDAETGLHANHIGPALGAPGAWRTRIPEKFHSEINQHYAHALTQWGYQLEADK